MKFHGVSGVALCALCLTPAAFAGEPATAAGSTITIEQASQYLSYSGGTDRMRVAFAPGYSEDLGFTLKGAVGAYLTDAAALGLIVEYGENKREYLANAGIQFTDALSLVGTIGMLEEHNEYVEGDGREKVQQMEYGASLKGAYGWGILSAFELNGYLADADADSDSVETGRLYGVQLLTDLDLTATTRVRLGGGYEWLDWSGGSGNDNSWTFSADASQQIGDALSFTGRAKLGASERVYGAGLAYDLSNGGPNTNALGLTYSYIDGRNGIEDDQRVELSWTIGFGAGPVQSASAAPLADSSGRIQAAADVAHAAPANTLLAGVMKRPAYLPERVLARSGQTGLVCTVLPGVTFSFGDNFPAGGTPGSDYDWINIDRNVFTAEQLAQIDLMTPADFVMRSGPNPGSLALYSPAYQPQLAFSADDGGSLYFQFSSADNQPFSSQDFFAPGDYVSIRFNFPDSCIEVMDQYVEQ